MTVGSQVKGCYASIKSIGASLALLANKTQHQESQQAFQEAKQLISEIKDDLQKHLIHLTREEPQYE